MVASEGIATWFTRWTTSTTDVIFPPRCTYCLVDLPSPCPPTQLWRVSVKTGSRRRGGLFTLRCAEVGLKT